MALSPEQYAEIAAQLNGFYGENTIDTDGDIEALVKDFLSQKITEYETKLADLAENPNPLLDFSALGPAAMEEITPDGQWDEITALRMLSAAFTLEGYIPLVISAEDLIKGFDAARAEVEASDLSADEKEAEINAITTSQTQIIAQRRDLSAEQLEAITETLNTFPATEVSLITELSDWINEKNTPQSLENIAIFNGKMELHRLIDTGLFGDIPNFDPKIEPLNPDEEAYIASTEALKAVLQSDNLDINVINERAFGLISEAVLPSLTQDQQDTINALPTTHEKILATLRTENVTDDKALYTLQQISIAYGAGYLPQNALQPASPTNTPAADPDQDGTAEAKAETEETPVPPPVDPMTQLATGDQLSLIEMAYARTFENTRRVPKADGYYSIDEQQFVYNHVSTLLSDYVSEDVLVTGASGQQYFIAQNGDIYGTQGDDTLTRADKIGNVLNGLRTKDDDGQARRPHEASVAFIALIENEMNTGAVASIGTGVPEDDNTKLTQATEQQQKLHNNFFAQNDALAALQDEYEETLKSNKGLGLERFQNSDFAKRIKQAADDDAAVDAFIIASFRFENQINGYGEAFAAFDQQHDTTGILKGFVSYLATDANYDPNAANKLLDGTYAGSDMVLNAEAYDILEFARGGEHILVEKLYDERNPAQKAEVLKSFGDRQSVTREEVYEFVKRQIDLRAIEELDPNITKADIAALDTVEAQNAFIQRNAATLQGVSQAMASGRFNPYEKDMHAVFRADPRPTLADPATQNAINYHRNNGTITGATYALNTMSDSDLRQITGREDFTTLPLSEQTEILDNVLAGPIEGFVGNEALERLTLNFYEDWIADYTYDRNEAWNDTYGEMTQDQLMITYLSQNWGKHAEIFGEETSAMFFQTGQRAYLNYDLTYDEAVANMSPDQKAILDRGIERVSGASMYQEMLVSRLGSYRYLRNNEYIPRKQEVALQEQFAAKATADAAAADVSVTTEGPNAKSDEDTAEEEAKADTEAGADNTVDTADVQTTMASIFPSLDIDFGTNFVNPIKANPGLIVSVINAANRNAPTLSSPDITFDDAAINRTYPTPKPEVRVVNPDAPKTVASASGTATAKFADEVKPSSITAGTITAQTESPASPGNITTQTGDVTARLNPSLDESPTRATSPRLQPPPSPVPVYVDRETGVRYKPRFEAAAAPPRVQPPPSPVPVYVDRETGVRYKPRFEAAATVAGENFTTPGLEATNLDAAKTAGTTAPPASINPSDPIPSNNALVLADTNGNLPALRNIPTIEPPGRLINAISNLGRFGKVFSRGALKYAGPVGALAGAGIAKAETEHLESQRIRLESLGLLPEEEELTTMLSELYTRHMRQASLDPSMVGGEVFTDRYANEIQEKFDIDPVVMSMIKPGLIIDLLFKDELSTEDYSRITEMFTEDRLAQMYDSIAEAYGLPKTVENIPMADGSKTSLPIGIAMRNPDLASMIIAEYLDNRFQPITPPEDSSREIRRAAYYINKADALRHEIETAPDDIDALKMSGMEYRRNQAVGEMNYYLNTLSDEDRAILEGLQDKRTTELRGLHHIRTINDMASIARGMELDGAITNFTNVIAEGATEFSADDFADAPPQLQEAIRLIDKAAAIRAQFEGDTSGMRPGKLAAIEMEMTIVEGERDTYLNNLSLEDIRAAEEYIAQKADKPTMMADANDITGQGDRDQTATAETALSPDNTPS